MDPRIGHGPLLATALHFLVLRRYENHSKIEEFRHASFSLLAACAAARGIKEQEAFDAWLKSERLTDPDFVMTALDKALRERIPDDAWLFDPDAVS